MLSTEVAPDCSNGMAQRSRQLANSNGARDVDELMRSMKLRGKVITGNPVLQCDIDLRNMAAGASYVDRQSGLNPEAMCKWPHPIEHLPGDASLA